MHERQFSYYSNTAKKDLLPKEISISLGNSSELGNDIVETIHNKNAYMTGVVTSSGDIYWSTNSQSHPEMEAVARSDAGNPNLDIVAHLQANNSLGRFSALYVVTLNAAWGKQVGTFLKNCIPLQDQTSITFALDTGINPQFTTMEQVIQARVFFHAVPGGKFFSGFNPNTIK